MIRATPRLRNEGEARRPRCATSYTRAVQGARITVKCDCGETNYLAYGDSWGCPTCGRVWNTNQIPSEEYWGLMREMRSERFKVIGMALSIATVFIVLALAVSQAFYFMLPIAISGWYLMFMPRWRSRVRRKAREAPSWNLRPE